MKKVLLFLVCLAVSALGAAELVVAERGRPAVYSVVMPDDADGFTKEMAELVSEAVFRTAGVRLPVVKESALKPGSPGVFIGQVKKLGNIPSLKHNEHRIEVRGRDIFLYGFEKRYGKNDSRFGKGQGSWIAAAEFLRKFCGAEMLFPGKRFEGLSVKPVARVAVPEHYKFARAPNLEFNIGRFHGLCYDTFNGHYRAPWFKEYGGHSYVRAVPVKKYYKEHPEYFALIRGKRHNGVYNHLCISNPTVQKLIKENVAENLREGYDMVQLSQTDGFRPCECENCAKLFGVKEFSEKLWILHRRIASELCPEFPGKFICMSSYGPTRVLPRTFKEFPPNVRIDLAPWTFDSMKIWKEYKVPGDFVCYDYTFGSYNEMGLTPKRPLSFITAHARNLRRDTRVHGIYRSGWGDMFGFEAPFYYVWNSLLRDPKLDPKALVRDFCTRLYGPAAPEMEKLVFLMNSRMEKFDLARPGDFNDPALLEGRRAENPAQIRLLLGRWTPETMKEIAKLLDAAEKKLPKTEAIKFFWPVVRRDFQYFLLTMRVLHAREALRNKPSEAGFRELVAASDARNRFIGAIPVGKNGKPLMIGEMFSFAGLEKRLIIANGRLRGELLFPFTGSVTLLKESGVAACGRVLRTGGAPQQLIGFTPATNEEPEVWKHPLEVSAKWDEKALAVTVRVPKGYPADMEQNKNQIFVRTFLGVGGKRYRFQGNRDYCVGQLRSAVCGVKGAQGDEYEGPKIKSSCRNRAADARTLVMTIPWADIGLTPAKGMKIDFNVYAQYGKNRIRCIWEYNPFQRNWRNPYDRVGTLILE